MSHRWQSTPLFAPSSSSTSTTTVSKSSSYFNLSILSSHSSISSFHHSHICPPSSPSSHSFHVFHPIPNPHTTTIPSFILSMKITLLDVSCILLLSSGTDWPRWHGAVLDMIDNLGLYHHITTAMPHLDAPYDLTLIPSYSPEITVNSPQDDVNSYKLWWHNDGVTHHIIVGGMDSHNILYASWMSWACKPLWSINHHYRCWECLKYGRPQGALADCH